MAEKAVFENEDGSKTEWYVEEQVMVGGKRYLLVTDSEEDDANALILEDVSGDDDKEAEYVPVEDEDHLQALLKLFEETMADDTKIVM